METVSFQDSELNERTKCRIMNHNIIKQEEISGFRSIAQTNIQWPFLEELPGLTIKDVLLGS